MHISKESYRKQSSWDSNKCTQDWIQVLKNAVQPAASQHRPHACQLHEGSTLLAFFRGPLGIGHAPGLLSMCIRMNIPECPQSLAWSISNSLCDGLFAQQSPPGMVRIVSPRLWLLRRALGSSSVLLHLLLSFCPHFASFLWAASSSLVLSVAFEAPDYGWAPHRKMRARNS